jgi:hypothetical protein
MSEIKYKVLGEKVLRHEHINAAVVAPNLSFRWVDITAQSWWGVWQGSTMPFNNGTWGGDGSANDIWLYPNGAFDNGHTITIDQYDVMTRTTDWWKGLRFPKFKVTFSLTESDTVYMTLMNNYNDTIVPQWSTIVTSGQEIACNWPDENQGSLYWNDLGYFELYTSNSTPLTIQKIEVFTDQTMVQPPAWGPTFQFTTFNPRSVYQSDGTASISIQITTASFGFDMTQYYMTLSVDGGTPAPVGQNLQVNGEWNLDIGLGNFAATGSYYTITASVLSNVDGSLIGSTSAATTPTDSISPVITSFTAGTPVYMTVPVTLTGTDNVGVVGYLLMDTPVPPQQMQTPAVQYFTMSTTMPTSYTAISAGGSVLYAYLIDAANNITVSTGIPMTFNVGPSVDFIQFTPVFILQDGGYTSINLTIVTDSTVYDMTQYQLNLSVNGVLINTVLPSVLYAGEWNMVTSLGIIPTITSEYTVTADIVPLGGGTSIASKSFTGAPPAWYDITSLFIPMGNVGYPQAIYVGGEWVPAPLTYSPGSIGIALQNIVALGFAGMTKIRITCNNTIGNGQSAMIGMTMDLTSYYMMLHNGAFENATEIVLDAPTIAQAISSGCTNLVVDSMEATGPSIAAPITKIELYY